MEILELQLKIVEKIFSDNHPRYKVFICPSNLYNILLNSDSINLTPIILKSNESSLKNHIHLENTCLNVIDIRNVSDIEKFIGIAKNWFYYGKESTGKIAFPQENYNTRYFSNDLKLASYELEMNNEYLLKNILENNID